MAKEMNYTAFETLVEEMEEEAKNDQAQWEAYEGDTTVADTAQYELSTSVADPNDSLSAKMAELYHDTGSPVESAGMFLALAIDWFRSSPEEDEAEIDQGLSDQSGEDGGDVDAFASEMEDTGFDPFGLEAESVLSESPNTDNRELEDKEVTNPADFDPLGLETEYELSHEDTIGEASIAESDSDGGDATTASSDGASASDGDGGGDGDAGGD